MYGGRPRPDPPRTLSEVWRWRGTGVDRVAGQGCHAESRLNLTLGSRCRPLWLRWTSSTITRALTAAPSKCLNGRRPGGPISVVWLPVPQ
jgi:hypothetical protein